MIDKELAMAAYKKWGLRRQINMCIEETGEFLQAWNKWNRNPEKEDHMIEEMVDCYIMFSQMRHIYAERFENALQAKLWKTEKKVYS